MILKNSRHASIWTAKAKERGGGGESKASQNRSARASRAMIAMEKFLKKAQGFQVN